MIRALDSILQAKLELDLAAMAAAPGGDLTAHLLLAPTEREKKGPTYLGTPPSTATAGWSSLPDDLVRRIADSFLDTNDVDCYMCFRAVCLSWRAATDDPRNYASDARFQPRLWIVVDEAQGKLLLLNTFTGRFLHTKLPPPLLRECHVVVTTPSGFVLLADTSPPHAARLFNPLTGVLTRFAAPVPPEASVADFGYNKDLSSLAILLLGDSPRKSYTAVPDSEGFTEKDCQEGAYNFFRNAVVGGAYEQISGPSFVSVFFGVFDFLRSLHADPVKAFSSDYADGIHCFLVGVGAQMVLVMRAYGWPILYKVDTKAATVQPVQSISVFAIFIGHRRCLSVDATKFSGIEANCVYYTQHRGSMARIWKYSLKDKKAERISEAAEFVKKDKQQFALVADRPFTTIQLLCSYTINIPDSQFALQQMS